MLFLRRPGRGPSASALPPDFRSVHGLCPPRLYSKGAGRPSAGGSPGGPLGCMAGGSHEAAPDCMASGGEAMQSDNVTAAVLLHPAVWPSRRPGEMPPEQGHVAPIGTEEDVADRTGHRYRTDQAIQPHIADHAQHHPGRNPEPTGLPDQVAGDCGRHDRPEAGHRLRSASAPKRMPVPG